MEIPYSKKRINEMVKKVIEFSYKCGIKLIVLPMLGKSRINPSDFSGVKSFLNSFTSILKGKGINLLIESDLKHNSFKSLIESISSNYININYDTGNSAYWSYDPEIEINSYGKYIKNVHIKDCTPKLYNVPLSKGDTKFDIIFDNLNIRDYQGDFILETQPGADSMLNAQKYFNFLNKLVIKHFKK